MSHSQQAPQKVVQGRVVARCKYSGSIRWRDIWAAPLCLAVPLRAAQQLDWAVIERHGHWVRQVCVDAQDASCQCSSLACIGRTQAYSQPEA